MLMPCTCMGVHAHMSVHAHVSVHVRKDDPAAESAGCSGCWLGQAGGLLSDCNVTNTGSKLESMFCWKGRMQTPDLKPNLALDF